MAAGRMSANVHDHRSQQGNAIEGGSVKVRNSLKALKKIPGSQVVRRRGRVYVINKKDPRWNTRQG
jgi:large subunit ribosomal protein L36